MRILITNDDGIDAPGIKVLERIAARLAPEAEIYVVAPLNERSGVAHCISYTTPARVEHRGARHIAVDGYPADCVLVGIYEALGGERPDLVLSGINRGNNSAENTLYSGTIGAAIEGTMQGAKSIALSQFYGPNNAGLENQFEAAEETGVEVIQKILDADHWGSAPYPIFYNVNFPPVAAKDVKGIALSAQGRRPDVNFRATMQDSPSGRRFAWFGGGAQAVETGEGTDCSANMAGYTSVTPMTCDLTAHDALTALKAKIG